MPITINGTGTIDGISVGGLTDGCVATADIANSAVTPAKLSQPLTLGTVQNSTSGTAIDFTGIPSWVKRITVMFNGVSTNGTSNPLVQLGSGSPATTGYLGSFGGYQSTASGATSNYTTGFGINSAAAANAIHGVMVFTLLGSNVWVASQSLGLSNANVAFFGGGSITLSSTLDRIRITTVNGTDTFDAGSINILYEG